MVCQLPYLDKDFSILALLKFESDNSDVGL